MKKYVSSCMLFLCIASMAFSQSRSYRGMMSVGTRNTFSTFEDDGVFGKGIGGQTRIQFSNRLNSEWFFDYITSHKTLTKRNDYHVGWSLMFYPGKTINFTKIFQPYILAGHCFDYSAISELDNAANKQGRWSMAAQAGIGSHINISPDFDCSISTQYMLHFGKEISAEGTKGNVIITKENRTDAHGHLLISISFNYKLFRLWS